MINHTKILITWLTLTCVAAADPQGLVHFITTQGDQLIEGDKQFRFMSFNIPNLHLVEDNFAFTDSNPWRWPNEFEIADALETIDQMGGKVTRSYVLSVKREGSDMGQHVFVRGPGIFNEDAFRVLDKVLQIANEKGIRVIVPLVDNWHWWGGRAEYAKFRGKLPDDFWSDEQIISDFEETILFTLNRVNSYTGIAYKDDPAIFGWETGNELDSTPEWTRRISAFIKRHDTNHLVIDGYALHGVRQESLDDPNIDVITTHHYPNTDKDYVAAISKAHQMTAGKKPYFVGEFGFAPTAELERVMDVIVDKEISGGLLWSLRVHRREGGFYWHSEPSGNNRYKAYHWPGFESGATYDEHNLLHLVRQKAFAINGQLAPALPPPAAPSLLPIADVSAISWQGSTGASSYDVLRSTSNKGPWEVVGKDLSDASTQYRPLFNDAEVEVGESYFYKVTAKNMSGASPFSNTIGPVKVRHHVLADECSDFAQLFSRSGEVELKSDSARKSQEDTHRFHLGPESTITYQVDRPLEQCRLMFFLKGGVTEPVISSSIDGKQYQPCDLAMQQVEVGEGDYGYSRPLLLQGKPRQQGARYLRIQAGDQASSTDGQSTELSRVEIYFGNETQSKKSKHNSLSRKRAQLNPSILMYHKPRHTNGVHSMRRAAALGCRRINVVVTLSCEINEDREVLSYGLVKHKKYLRLNEKLRAEFLASLQEIFSEAVALDLDISVLAHLNAGTKPYDWRNNFRFDPLAKYSGYSYQQAIIAPIMDALSEACSPEQHIDFSLAGEMGTSVFQHAESYSKIMACIRENKSTPQLNLGISFNFSTVAGEGEITAPERATVQQLIDECDFIGLSNYRWFDLPIQVEDFSQAVQEFLKEMKEHGAHIPTEMPLHFSEVGIGGGKEKGLATTPLEASKTPWNGSDNAKENPWKSAEMRQFRVRFHRSLLEFLASPISSNPITEAFLWSEGSWDPMDITDEGFADTEIIQLIQQHNAQAHNH